MGAFSAKTVVQLLYSACDGHHRRIFAEPMKVSVCVKSTALRSCGSVCVPDSISYLSIARHR